MEERAQGIVLRHRPLTETSLIVHWLTAEAGRISTVAKGARRSNSSFRGKVDLCYEADFSFSRSTKSTLYNLREIRLTGTHPLLRQDFCRLQQCAYGAILVEKLTEADAPLPGVLTLFQSLVEQVESGQSPRLTVWCFEARLLDLMGLLPEPQNAGLDMLSAAVLAQLLADDRAVEPVLTQTTAHRINAFLQCQVALNIGGVVPPARRLALETQL